jgi:hypothetical protein
MLPVKVPSIEKWPASSVVATVPALEPSMTSTLEPAKGLFAVSLTAPDSRNSCSAGATEGGEGSTGALASPHPRETSIKTAVR